MQISINSWCLLPIYVKLQLIFYNIDSFANKHTGWSIVALNCMENSRPYFSQICNSVRIALGVGANKTMSSAYARAPTNTLPIQHPTFESFSLCSNPSIYYKRGQDWQYRLALTQLSTEKELLKTPKFQRTWATLLVYILNNRRKWDISANQQSKQFTVIDAINVD